MAARPDFKRFAVFLGLNFCLALAVSSYFLLFTGGHPLELVFAATALVSNTAMLLLAVSIPALLLFLVFRGAAAPAVLLGAFQLWLVTDAAVYKLFKFHMNSMVLNLVLTPGGLESLDQGWGTKALFFAIAALLGAAQWFFWRLAGREGLPGSLSARRLAALAGLLLVFVLADKGVYAWGNLYDSPYITRNSKLFPFYQPLTIKKFASKKLGVKLDGEVKAGIALKYSGLDYPKAELVIEPPARPLNVLFLVVDSLRADMLTPEVMPETWAFSKKASLFEKHYSGGNCTRFGIFSMLYGLYGNYWFPMLAERRGPALLGVLRDQGYDLRAYASAPLSFPEFNKTCFVDVPRAGIYDEPSGADGALRDREISGKFIDYLKSRDRKKPYFSFIFYDASHGNYDYEPAYEKFRPTASVNRLLLSAENYLPLFNRYKNSVYYEDVLIGRILKAVRETGGLEDTVVVIAGDHGEPFFDKGYYGHNQAYSEEEVRVPLVLYVPGRPPAAYAHATSHLDLPAALLGLAGVKNPPSDYSSGGGLFSAPGREYVTAFSWDTAALLFGGETLVMPLEAYRGGVKVYDRDYREQPKARVKDFTPQLRAFQKEAGRFSK